MDNLTKIENALYDTVKLLRYYIERVRPQSFASLYPTFEKQIKQCKVYNIKTEPYQDIYDYAKKERIEQYGFRG